MTYWYRQEKIAVGHFQGLRGWGITILTTSELINNYSSSPNGLWVNSQKASWAIDSEAMRAMGITVLVKSNKLVENIETKQL